MQCCLLCRCCLTSQLCILTHPIRSSAPTMPWYWWTHSPTLDSPTTAKYASLLECRVQISACEHAVWSNFWQCHCSNVGQERMLFCRNSILATVLVCLCVSFRESSANYCLSSFSPTHSFPLSSSLAQERRLIGVCTHIIGNQSKPKLLSELNYFCIVHARKSRTYVCRAI